MPFEPSATGGRLATIREMVPSCTGFRFGGGAMKLVLGSAVVAAALMKGLLVGLAIGGAVSACALCAKRRNSRTRDETEAKEPA